MWYGFNFIQLRFTYIHTATPDHHNIPSHESFFFFLIARKLNWLTISINFMYNNQYFQLWTFTFCSVSLVITITYTVVCMIRTNQSFNQIIISFFSGYSNTLLLVFFLLLLLYLTWSWYVHIIWIIIIILPGLKKSFSPMIWSWWLVLFSDCYLTLENPYTYTHTHHYHQTIHLRFSIFFLYSKTIII